MLLWISALLLFCYALLLGYYRYHWRRLPGFEPLPHKTGTFLSVVVAARNEARHLPRLLAALERQTLRPQQFEVIVVDDYSTDNTAESARPYLSERVHCIMPDVPPERSSKKQALTAGVARARGPLVVVTDADCLPQPSWLELAAACYEQYHPAFMVMPVQFTAPATVLGCLQQLDFAMLQGVTGAAIGAGAHSMCNGANLAYEKQAFVEVGGFEGIDAKASGDDMLLLHRIAQRHPHRIHYLKHQEAIMPTPAPASWRSFLQQRIRWSSKATYYEDQRITAVLFFVYAFNLWCLGLLLGLFINAALWPYALFCIGAKTLIELLLLAPVAAFFRITTLLWYFPLLQPLHLLYTVLIGLLSRRKTYQWKGRTTQ